MESCIICGCVKDCEQHLEKVFENIAKIQKLFGETKIIISFDISKDLSLKKLCELKTKLDIEIIINKDPITNSRTVNIERARNKALDLIYEKYSNFDYFIMIDMDDVSAKPIYIESLINGLNKKKEWDALFFNNQNYYDFWALCIDDFQYSCWHSNNTNKLINIIMKLFHQQSHQYQKLFDMGVAAVFGPGTIISEAAQDNIKIMLKGFLKK